MARYVNTGPRFPRDDGSIWDREETGDPTPRELAMFGYHLELAEGEEPEPPDPLEGVVFGSPDAETLARDEELAASDFDGRLGTGQGHAFLVADVRAVMGEEPEEGEAD